MPLLCRRGLAVAAGARICLVGRNGSGKSTLLCIAAGLVQPDAGETLRFSWGDDPVSVAGTRSDRFGTTLAYVEPGLTPRRRTVITGRCISPQGTRPFGRQRPGSLSRRCSPRGARAGAGSCADILCSTSRPTHLDLPGIEAAGTRVGRDALRHRADQP